MMVNRVAETLYWIGRYVERAEATSRVLDVQFHSDVEHGLRTSGLIWEALLRAIGGPPMSGEFSERAVVDFAILSRDNPSSVLSCLATARDNARTVRERISREFWEELNACYLEIKEADANAVLENLSGVCRRIQNTAHLVLGLADATLLHDEGLYWLKTGLFLERADMTTRFIDAKAHLLLPTEGLGPSMEHFQWSAILRSMSAWEAYRKVDTEGISGRAIISFLLFESRFPRSVRFALEGSAGQFELATVRTPQVRKTPVLRLYGDLINKVRYDDVTEVIRAGVHAYLDDFQVRISAISGALSAYIFQYIPERVG